MQHWCRRYVCGILHYYYYIGEEERNTLLFGQLSPVFARSPQPPGVPPEAYTRYSRKKFSRKPKQTNTETCQRKCPFMPTPPSPNRAGVRILKKSFSIWLSKWQVSWPLLYPTTYLACPLLYPTTYLACMRGGGIGMHLLPFPSSLFHLPVFTQRQPTM